MNKGLVRILSLLLVVTMCVSTFGLTAFAALISDFSAPPLALEQTADEDEGTVTVTVKANSAFTFMGASATIEYDKTAFNLTTNAITGAENLSLTKNVNVDNGATVVVTTDEDVEFNSGDTFLTFEFTKIEGISDGTYSFVLDVTGWTNANYGSDTFTNSKTNTVNYTISSTTSEVTEAYTAALSSTTTTVNNDGTSTVSVDVVVGGTTGRFASTEIKLAYDPAYLTFNANDSSCKLSATVSEGQTDQAVSISPENGVITIRDYGGTMAVEETGTTAYTLVFNTVKGGTTDVSLTSAGFSTQGDAASNNLTYVTDTDSKVNVTINHEATITVDGTAGDTTYVAPNGTYTYQISGYDATKYNYTVTATEGNNSVDASRISTDSTGKVTITGVSGELAVTITKAANSYNITWTDNESAITSGKPASQNYGTDVTVTVKAGSKAADATADGYYYSVKVYLTSDTNKSALAYTSNSTDKYAEQTYTIDDAVITGDITIEVTKVEEKATEATITIEGDFTQLTINGTVPASNTVTVTKGKEVTVTVTEEDGYTYKVEIVAGETATELTKDTGGNYTFTPNEATTLKVTKTLNTTSLAVSKYVQLDGKTMWLVQINGLTDTNGKTYTYTASEGAAAESFFWSSKYTLTGNTTAGAYCFLVVTDTNTDADSVKDDLAGKIGLTGTAATTISYNGNVNLTTNSGVAVIDVNDAQLVWNMYSAVYSGIDTNVTAQKFLEADMDNSSTLTTADAAAVVAKIQ